MGTAVCAAGGKGGRSMALESHLPPRKLASSHHSHELGGGMSRAEGGHRIRLRVLMGNGVKESYGHSVDLTLRV